MSNTEFAKQHDAARRLREINAELVAACRAMIAWDDAEKAGPDYGTLTRDSHPDSAAIWQRWWDDQDHLCRRAFDLARTAIAKAK